MKHILFLYTEIADYFLSCCEYLAKDYKITIIRWPINKEAPFELSLDDSIQIIEKNENWNSIEQELKAFNFDLIIVSGWIDRDYVKLAHHFRKKNKPTVLTLDNHWTGGIKQRVAKLLAPFTLQRIFDYAWVPGAPQENYARKLGFKPNQIFQNFYCANEILFQTNYQNIQSQKKESNRPKRFIYVGRYLEHKGIFDLWKAFQEFRQTNKDWELWCIGTGDEWENRVESDGIKHFGFIQPENLGELLKETDVFILPSHFEPWGVVVHETAIVGFPMLLSKEIGAGSKFLHEGKNGYSFQSKNPKDLLHKMKKIAQLSSSELGEMGKISHHLGSELNFKKWSEVPRKILLDN